MTILEWILARRYQLGWCLALVATAGAWFGPWAALAVVGVLMAWNRP